MPSSRISRSLYVFLVASAIAQLVVLVLWGFELVVTRKQHHALVIALGIPLLVCVSLFNLWNFRRMRRQR